jgi:hypothetical protein
MIQPVVLFRGEGVPSLIGTNLRTFQLPFLPENYKNRRCQSSDGWSLALHCLAQSFPGQVMWGVGAGTAMLCFRA